MNYSILDFSSNTLRTFPNATSLESFAVIIWNYEKRTTESKASDIIKEWLSNDDDREVLSLDDVAMHISENLVNCKHHLVIDRRSATSKERDIIRKALEVCIEKAIEQLIDKGILSLPNY